jgi:hypothetical protein
MKTTFHSRNFFKTFASALVLAFFIWLASGSIGRNNTYNNNDDTYRLTLFAANHLLECTAKIDSFGNYQGRTVRKYYNDTASSQNLVYTETADYTYGVRHGAATNIDASGKTTEYCYNMGQLVPCNKSGQIGLIGSSAFEILKNKYPWYLFEIMGYGIPENKVKAYVDTIEMKLNKFEFAESKIDSIYSIVLDETNNKPEFDTIYDITDFIKSADGLELLKKDQYRMAVIQHFRSGKSTFTNIGTTYPGYLKTINGKGISTPDFQGFCLKMDSLMASNGSLKLNDHFFLDSIDNRLYNALNYINSTTKSALIGKKNFNAIRSEIKATFNVNASDIQQTIVNSTPKDVSNVVINLMLEKMNEADIIFYSVKEAYYKKKSLVMLPTVTSVFSNVNSKTSVTIRGNVIESGGANITARGIAYAVTYDPTILDKTVPSGLGTGEFNAIINGLTEGTIYYARAYATNSKGTAYGNVISFNTSTTSSAGYLKADGLNLKVFPNPASRSTVFSFNILPSENYTLSIYNLKGQVVFSTNIVQPGSGEFRKTVDLSGFSAGIYTCILTNGISKSECRLLIGQQ